MSTIQVLERKITLLDEYASTLQKQNIAKNRQTQTLYAQINDVRQQNDILRHHLQMIRMANHQKNMQNLAISVRNSVEVQKFNNRFNSRQQNSASCQTDYIQELNHDQCTQEISKLTRLLTQKQSKIATLTSQGQQMYEAIQTLEEQLQKHNNKQASYEEAIKKLQEKIRYFKYQNSNLQAQESRLNNSFLKKMKNQQNCQKQEFELLVKQNNQLIEKVRYLQKQKNSYYHQLKSVSPLKSKIHNNESRKYVDKNQTMSLFQTKKPGMFVSNKTKMKNQRWKMIQSKINQLKSQNQQIKANLNIN